MKSRVGLLIICFIAFYAMIHLGRYVPDLFRGKFSLVDERSYSIRLFSLGSDLALAFLYTLSSYYILYIAYPSKKYFFLLAGLSLTFVLCFALHFKVTQAIYLDPPVLLTRFFRLEILYSAFYFLFGMAFYFIRYAQHKELQEKEVAVQNRNAELSFLRSQINPHFLFNNLNNIYSLVYHKSEQSLAAISSLSDLLRYMLYDTSETITLDKEIHYIEKYIELEQLRHEMPGKLSFTYPDDAHQYVLPPLLLIPFVENAFKHGAIATDHTWLDISIDTGNDGSINFTCTNDMGTKRKDAVGGIGIENVRKRLALLYPGNHRLDIAQLDNQLKVNLSFPIQLISNEIS